MDRIREIIVEEIKSNENLSEKLANFALELYDEFSESDLYRDLAIVNASHPKILHGHLSFEEGAGHQTRYSLPGCSIELQSFSVSERDDSGFELKIKKIITVGFNTNDDVERYAHHDYIAPSINNSEVSFESFSIKNISDFIDVIDNICFRTIDEQISSIKDISEFENGENFSTMLQVNEKVKNGEKIKFSFFKSSN